MIADSVFADNHPLVIQLGDGHVLRFRDLVGAARSACWHKREIWDEANGRAISLLECHRIANGAEKREAA